MLRNHRLFLVLYGSFLAQIVQVGIFPLFLAQKLSDLGVSLPTIGWVVGSQWLAVLIIAPFIPRFMSKISLEQFNRISGAVTVIGLLLITTNHLVLIMLSAPFIGAGLIQRWVSCDVLVVRLSPKNKMGRMIGIHEALMGFAIAVGPLMFAWLSLNQVLIAALLIATISTMLFFLIGKNEVVDETEDTPLLRADFFLIQIALVAALTGGFIETAAIAFFPFYFEENGFPLTESALFVASFGLGGTLLQLPLGLLADKIGYRLAQLIVSITALASLGLTVIYGSSFTVVIAVLFIMGGAVGAFNTLAVLQAGAQISAKKSAAAMAAIAFSYTLGGILGPIISAWTLEHYSQNMVISVYTLTICILLGVIVSTRLRPSNT
ncbi:MAG: MFS transporter [Hyphomicrobiales bacterium]